MLWPAEKLLPVTGTEQQKKKTQNKLNTNKQAYIYLGELPNIFYLKYKHCGL